MAAASLDPALAQAAGDRGVLAQRAAARQVAVATVTALAIRDLTPGSVTVTVTAAQVITSSSGTSRSSAGLGRHPHPRRLRLAGVGHRARRRGQLLKEAPLMPHPAAERGSATVTVATAAALLLLLLAVIAGAVGGITGQEASACTAQPAASSAAASIPANYLADFKKAGTEYGIPWTVLAAIGEVESGFGAERRAVQRRRPRPHAVRAVDLGAVRRRRRTSWTRPTPSPPPPGSSSPTARPATSSRPSSPTTTPASYVSDVLYLGRPLLRRRRAGHLRRRQRRVPAGRPRPAARRHRREDPRLRRGPARQALHLRGDRPGRVRLLGPGHDGLPRRRDRHPAHQPGPVGLRHGRSPPARSSRATWSSSPEPTGPRPPPGTSASSSTRPPTP